MHRDPRELTQDEEGRKLSGRAWGLLLGTWAAFFSILALVVLPVLFSLCGPR